MPVEIDRIFHSTDDDIGTIQVLCKPFADPPSHNMDPLEIEIYRYRLKPDWQSINEDGAMWRQRLKEVE